MPIVRKNRPPPLIKKKSSLINRKVKILDSLKHMNINDIRKIWSDLGRDIEHITYCPIYETEGRYIIFVISIKLKGSQERMVNELFYRSTGTSREGTDTKGVWFPGGKLILGDGGNLRIEKGEDEIIYRIESDEITDFTGMDYGRFIKEIYAYVSKGMYGVSLDDSDFVKINTRSISLDDAHKILDEQTESCKLRMIEY